MNCNASYSPGQAESACAAPLSPLVSASGWVVLSVILALAVLVSGCVTAGPADRAGGEAVEKRLLRAFDSTVKAHNVSGAVALVHDTVDGTTWAFTYGVRWPVHNRLHDNPAKWSGPAMTRDSYFRIADITKTYTATLILMLHDDGALSLDDTLKRWLPDLHLRHAGDITIRDLLGMTSGLREYASPQFMAHVMQHPGEAWTPRELVAIAAGQDERFPPQAPPTAPPGGDFARYRHTNYILLGMIAERAGQDSFDNLVRYRILTPLGLSQTRLPMRGNPPLNFSEGWARIGKAPWTNYTFTDPSSSGAAGYMAATADDLLKWLDAFSSGRLLERETALARFEFMHPLPGCANQRYGLGLAEIDGAVGHDGMTLGYTSAMFQRGRYQGVVLAAGLDVARGNAARAALFAMFARLGESIEPCAGDTQE